MRRNFEASMRKFKIPYTILGEGEIWRGFVENKIKGVLRFLKGAGPGAPEIIAVTDCLDFIACRSYDEILDAFMGMKEDLIIGAEAACSLNCVEPIQYWKQKGDLGMMRYANGGFYMGKRANVMEMLEYVVSQGDNDDQRCIGKFMNAYPEKVALDNESKLVANMIQKVKEMFYISKSTGRLVRKDSKSQPGFLHIPNAGGDKFARVKTFFPPILEGDYTKPAMMDFISLTFVKVVKGHGAEVAIGLILFSFCFGALIYFMIKKK